MEYFSHPEKRLMDHLGEVRQFAFKYNHYLDEKLVDIASVLHDFGKYTTYFQDRLNKKQSKDKAGNHSFLSAIFAAYAASQAGMSREAVFLVYSVILSHHSRIKWVEKYLPSTIREFNRFVQNGFVKKSANDFEAEFKTVMVQMEDLRRHQAVIQEELEKLSTQKDIRYAEYFQKFLNNPKCMGEVFLVVKKQQDDNQKRESIDLYWQHQLLFSLLVTADKLSASNTVPFTPGYLPFSQWMDGKNAYLGSPEPSTLNTLRGQIFDAVQNSIEHLQADESLLSITAPTGTGKTLTGFFAAQKLKDRFPELKQVVYVLPFTSIIDQNYEVIQNILSKAAISREAMLPYLMKHHHLTAFKNSAETAQKEETTEVYTPDQFQMLLENWEAGTIVTTFVQFLETLVSADNRMLKKFHAFQDTIFVLDEIQAIDVHFYELIEYLLKKITEKFHCKIILMTATKPLFFPEMKELLEDHETYFKCLNRTRLHINLEKVSVESFCQQFVSEYQNKDEKPSTMIVVNTIAESLEIFNLLKKDLEDIAEITYLSTNLIPKHRRERIEAVNEKLKTIKKSTQEKPLILVTTQMVEAGVDFDFDAVVRDFAPFDAIIQCAGRCNRNAAGKPGEVSVCPLTDDQGRPFGGQIYGLTSLELTKEVLEKQTVIEENEYLFYINQYYEKVKEKSSQDVSDHFIKAIETMTFNPDNRYEIGHFHLIKDQLNKEDVFVVLDDEAEILLTRYEAAMCKKSLEKIKDLAQLKKEMQDYTLALPVKFLRSLEEKSFYSGKTLWILPKDGMDMYDCVTGFDRQLDENGMFL